MIYFSAETPKTRIVWRSTLNKNSKKRMVFNKTIEVVLQIRVGEYLLKSISSMIRTLPENKKTDKVMGWWNGGVTTRRQGDKFPSPYRFQNAREGY